jgi:hypothetical protein
MLTLFSRFIAPGSVLVPFIIGLWRYKVLNTSFRFLLGLLAFSALSSILARAFAILYHNNLVIIKFYTVGEFLLLGSFYYHQYLSLTMRRAILCMMVLFTIFALYLIVIYAHVIRYDDFAPAVESVIMIFLGTTLISRNNGLLPHCKRWSEYPVNWFNTGILLYFSGSMFMFLFANFNTDADSITYIITRLLHGTFLILLSTLFTMGFLKIKK